MDDYNKHNDEFENIGENNENFYGNEGYLEEEEKKNMMKLKIMTKLKTMTITTQKNI